MNKNVLIIVILTLAMVSYALFRPVSTEFSKGLRTGNATYSNVDLGIEFTYPVGNDGYILTENYNNDPRITLLKTLVLTPTSDAGTYSVSGESPATIEISIIRNTEKQWPELWAENNYIYSSINTKMRETSNTVVGGANGIRYIADGLYASDNTVVGHGDNIYVFKGMFVDENSKTKIDYQPILDSVKFIPAPWQQ